jgi:hypothetical protein
MKNIPGVEKYISANNWFQFLGLYPLSTSFLKTIKWTKSNDEEPLQVICGVQKTKPCSKKLAEYVSWML